MDKVNFSNSVEDYRTEKVIGKGASSVVYSAVHIPTKTNIAVKVIDLEEGIPFDVLAKELKVWKLLGAHENVVQYHTSFVVDTKIWMAMELMEYGSIGEILKLDPFSSKGFEESLVASLLIQALKGLLYLHENSYIHRDIKSGNILISKEGEVKLADFGGSIFLLERGVMRSGGAKTFVGTPCWMSPEIIEEKPYDEKTDVWSMGITAIELASGSPPRSKHTPLKILKKIVNDPPPRLPNSYSKNLRNFVSVCLQKDPKKRPTVAQLLKHRLFKGIEDPKKIILDSLVAKVPPLDQRVGKLEERKEKFAKLQQKVVWDYNISKSEKSGSNDEDDTSDSDNKSENENDDDSSETDYLDSTDDWEEVGN